MNPWLIEGDVWFRRNQKALETAAQRDWALRLIEKHSIVNAHTPVLEVGCANGWRLDELNRRYGCSTVGTDISWEAIDAANTNNPDMAFYHQTMREAVIGDFRLIICYFVLHWIERGELLSSMVALDEAMATGGHLIIGDFLPDAPTKVPYHHREGLWTWKADYAGIFLATGNYRLIDRVIFDHDTGEEGDMSISVNRRAVVSLLKKEECYLKIVKF